MAEAIGCRSETPSKWFVEDSDRYERHLYEASRWIVRRKTKFQDVAIIHNRAYGRILFLDGALQSTEADEYVYHEALVHPVMSLHPNPRHVLILGGGEGATLREVLRHRSVERATMVDIDGELVSLCRRYLPEWSGGAFNDPRTQLIIGDGLKWVEETADLFDVIVMDLTDQIDLGPSFQLYTQNFYEQLKGRLNPNGLLVVQASELSVCENASHGSIRKTLDCVFPHTRTYAQHIPSFFAQWGFIVAGENPIPRRVNVAPWNRRIARRSLTPLRFYDAGTHNRMFSISKDLAAVIEESGAVVTDRKSFAAAYNTHQQWFRLPRELRKTLCRRRV